MGPHPVQLPDLNGWKALGLQPIAFPTRPLMNLQQRWWNDLFGQDPTESAIRRGEHEEQGLGIRNGARSVKIELPRIVWSVLPGAEAVNAEALTPEPPTIGPYLEVKTWFTDLMEHGPGLPFDPPLKRLGFACALYRGTEGGEEIRLTFRQETARSTDNQPGAAGSTPFLETVYLLAETGHVRRAAARIMEHVDSLRRHGLFEGCDRLLLRIDVQRLRKHPTLLVGFGGITLGAKPPRLLNGRRFFGSVKASLSDELGPERAERALARFQ